MGLDDVVSKQSAFVAAATAAVFSPKTRETVRRGAVYGLAGVLRAGDVIGGAARGVARGVRGEETPASGADGGGTASTGGTASAKGTASTKGTSRAGAGRSRSRRTTDSAASTRRAAATAKSGGSAAQS